MTITKAALLAVGYVLGARAGRERYDQIAQLAGEISHRLEEFSARHPPTNPDERSRRADPDN